MLPIVGVVFASGGGLGWPLLAFPCPVRSRLIGGAPGFASHELWHVLNELVTNAGPGGPPKFTKLSVTGFLLSCSIVQACWHPVRTPAMPAPASLFTNSELMSGWTHTGLASPPSLAGTPNASSVGGTGLGNEAGVRQ